MGVWQKFGTVIMPLSTDSNTGLFGGTSNQDVLYDTNPQLISPNADAKVFKMWFMGKDSLFYAESNDGRVWTRKAAALLANVGQPRIFKNTGTYYLYATAGEPTQTNAVITTYTATDGITFTSQGTGLGLGTGFDSTGVFYLKPWFKTGNTWSAIYSALAGQQGIATSTDLIHWTNAAAALNVTAGGPYPLVINGKYYIWTATNIGGVNNQLSRVSSPDTVTWSSPIFILPETQANEGAGNTGAEGQGVPSVVTGPNGWTYLYYTGTGADTGASYTIMGAVAKMSLGELVGTNEGAIALPVPILGPAIQSDNMQRANESPLSDGGNWSIASSPNVAANLVSNIAEATSTFNASRMCWTGSAWPANQYSKITIGAVGSTSNGVGPAVLNSTLQTQGYEAIVSTTAYTLRALLPGGSTAINLQTGSGTFSAGDVLELIVANGILYFYQNGALVTSAFDSMFQSGDPGFTAYDSATPANTGISAWAGGSARLPNTGTGRGTRSK